MNQKQALFSFQGRMRRKDYWIYSIPVMFLMLPTFFYSGGSHVLDIIALGLSLLSLYMSLALNMKRLKDRNRPTFWIVFTIIPLVGPIYALIDLGFLEGTNGANQYGEDPKQTSNHSGVDESDEPQDSNHFNA